MSRGKVIDPETRAECLGNIVISNGRIWAIASLERALKGKKAIDTNEITVLHKSAVSAVAIYLQAQKDAGNRVIVGSKI